MCWIGKAVKMKAEKDMPCFKVMKFLDKDKVESVYFRKEYTLGRLCCIFDVIEPRFSSIMGDEIDYGFHSYHNDVKVIYKSEKDDTTNLSIVFLVKETGYLRILDGLRYRRNLCKVECIIPKGSTYYINEQGEYVSNMIQPIKVLEKYR